MYGMEAKRSFILEVKLHVRHTEETEDVHAGRGVGGRNRALSDGRGPIHQKQRSGG